MHYADKSQYTSGHTEITYEQFKKYVLKEESNNTIAIGDGLLHTIMNNDEDELPF